MWFLVRVWLKKVLILGLSLLMCCEGGMCGILRMCVVICGMVLLVKGEVLVSVL